MIDGLKLTMTGGELQAQLAARIDWHRGRVLDFQRELTRSDPDGTTGVRVPEHVVAHMRDEHQNRVSVLALIHDHVIESETYRLGEADLMFAELIAEPPEE